MILVKIKYVSLTMFREVGHEVTLWAELVWKFIRTEGLSVWALLAVWVRVYLHSLLFRHSLSSFSKLLIIHDKVDIHVLHRVFQPQMIMMEYAGGFRNIS